MKVEKLITMANQIGDFFGANPDQAAAKYDIAKHIKRFWARNMRQTLIEHVQQQQGQGLHAVVKSAVQDHETMLT